MDILKMFPQIIKLPLQKKNTSKIYYIKHLIEVFGKKVFEIMLPNSNKIQTWNNYFADDIE